MPSQKGVPIEVYRGREFPYSMPYGVIGRRDRPDVGVCLRTNPKRHYARKGVSQSNGSSSDQSGTCGEGGGGITDHFKMAELPKVTRYGFR